MIPTQEEQDKKLGELYKKWINPVKRKEDILYIMELYAKWYATEVIKHCAEVAEIEYTYENPLPNATHTKPAIINGGYVDKKSILNIINLL